jgi:hypothetical protein
MVGKDLDLQPTSNGDKTDYNDTQVTLASLEFFALH